MGLRLGIFSRAFDSDGGEGGEAPRGSESSTTFEASSRKPEQVGTHPRSETDPTSMPTTQEWQVADSATPDAEVPPPDTNAETAGPNPWLSNGELERRPAKSAAPIAPDSDIEEQPRAHARRRGDAEDRIRVAGAGAVGAAEQRPSEEILALEKDLERAETEAAAKLEELEGRLNGMEDRAASAEREAQKALTRIADVERTRAAAEESAQRAEKDRPGEGAEEVEKRVAAMRAPEPTASASQIAAAQGGPVSLASATFDDLRALGLSITQAKRVVNFRERLGGFESLDDLDDVPGFPKSILAELKTRLTT